MHSSLCSSLEISNGVWSSGLALKYSNTFSWISLCFPLMHSDNLALSTSSFFLVVVAPHVTVWSWRWSWSWSWSGWLRRCKESRRIRRVVGSSDSVSSVWFGFGFGFGYWVSIFERKLEIGRDRDRGEEYSGLCFLRIWVSLIYLYGWVGDVACVRDGRGGMVLVDMFGCCFTLARLSTSWGRVLYESFFFFFEMLANEKRHWLII